MGYFDNFKKASAGIPGVRMNAPVAPRVVPGDVGLEIELEGERFPFVDDVARFRVGNVSFIAKTDGSLRGEAFEYVLSAPAPIADVPVLVRELYRKFNARGTRLNLSNRCSTHVHLNVSSWKIDKISAFLAIWAALEPGLVRYCGTDRHHNHFCLGVEDTTATHDAWFSYLLTGREEFVGGLKYSALNLLRLYDLGSLEVRIAPAYANPEQVIEWAQFLWALREYVASDLTPDNIPEELSFRQPAGVFVEVCERAGLTDFRDRVLAVAEDFNKDGMAAFREVQKICYGVPWRDYYPLINKDFAPNPFAKKSRSTNDVRDIDIRPVVMPRIRLA